MLLVKSLSALVTQAPRCFDEEPLELLTISNKILSINHEWNLEQKTTTAHSHIWIRYITYPDNRQPLWKLLGFYWTEFGFRPNIADIKHHHMADATFAPSQWETALLCNNASHWLGTSLHSALHHIKYMAFLPFLLNFIGKLINSRTFWQCLRNFWLLLANNIFVIIDFKVVA